MPRQPGLETLIKRLRKLVGEREVELYLKPDSQYSVIVRPSAYLNADNARLSSGWLVSGDGHTLRLALEQAILDMRSYGAGAYRLCVHFPTRMTLGTEVHDRPPACKRRPQERIGANGTCQEQGNQANKEGALRCQQRN